LVPALGPFARLQFAREHVVMSMAFLFPPIAQVRGGHVPAFAEVGRDWAKPSEGANVVNIRASPKIAGRCWDIEFPPSFVGRYFLVGIN
jgi:hypothetical protein